MGSVAEGFIYPRPVMFQVKDMEQRWISENAWVIEHRHTDELSKPVIRTAVLKCLGSAGIFIISQS